MTLNRTLITITILILGTLAYLSFASPQTGKWVYLFQQNVYPRVSFWDEHHAEPMVPIEHQGRWVFHFDSTSHAVGSFSLGVLIGPLSFYKNNVLTVRRHPPTEREFDIKYEEFFENGRHYRVLLQDGTVAYDAAENIDRRNEFGIEVE